MLVMEELLTPEEVAKLLKISEYKLREMLRTGEIKGVKVGGQWRIRPSDYRDYLKSLGDTQPEQDR